MSDDKRKLPPNSAIVAAKRGKTTGQEEVKQEPTKTLLERVRGYRELRDDDEPPYIPTFQEDPLVHVLLNLENKYFAQWSSRFSMQDPQHYITSVSHTSYGVGLIGRRSQHMHFGPISYNLYCVYDSEIYALYNLTDAAGWTQVRDGQHVIWVSSGLHWEYEDHVDAPDWCVAIVADKDKGPLMVLGCTRKATVAQMKSMLLLCR